MGQTINASDVFPSYLNPLINIGISPQFIIGLILAGMAIFVYLKYLSIKKSLEVKYSFLEIKPTDRTLKSPLSTNQLFTVIHSLIKDESPGLFVKTKKNISFELVSTKEDGIRFVLRVPSNESSTIKKNLLAYLSGIEIKEVDDYVFLQLGEVKHAQNLAVQEAKLKNSYLLPLQDQEILSQHDPIAYITAHMTKLLDHEIVAAQFICTPIHESTHSRIAGIVKETQDRLENGLDISDLINKTKSSPILGWLGNAFTFAINSMVFAVLSITTVPIALLSSDPKVKMFPTGIFGNSKGKRINDLGVPKQQQYQKVNEKINQPLFETVIRFIVYTPFKEGISDRLRGMSSSYETLNSPYQALKVKKPLLQFIKTEFLSNLRFSLLQHRLSLFGNNPILSVSELSSMYHLPYTATTKTEDLLQVKSPQLPPPLSLKQSGVDLDITFAKNNYGESTTPIGLTLEERRRHTYIIGATGTGKSTLLLHMINQDMTNGRNLAVIDPHGELVERLLGIIPQNRRKDVVYFDPYDIEFPIGLNLLELPKDLFGVELQREKDFITSNLISVFHKLYDARYTGPRMEHILRNVILTALELENPTLFTIYELLTKVKFRKSVTSNLQDEVLKTFWKDEFDKFGSFQRAEQISPITNKLGRFLTTALTRNILNQKTSKLNFDDVMNNGKILLCNLSKGKVGEDVSYFLGSLIIAKIQLTALRRIHLPQERRNDFFLYIDEFQNFATTSFAQVISFRTTSPNDEGKVLPIFTPQVEKGQIANLPSYNFYIKINALKPQDTFTGEIDDFPLKADEIIMQEVSELSRNRYATKVDVSKIKTGLKVPVTTKKNAPRNKVNKVELKD